MCRRIKFPYFSKGKRSPLGLYRNPPTFFLTNPCFVLLIHYFFCSFSAFVTNHATQTSYVIRRNGVHVPHSAEVRKKCLLHLKYGYLYYKNVWIHYRRPLFTHSPTHPEPCEACFIMNVCNLFHVFWTVDKKLPLTPL